MNWTIYALECAAAVLLFTGAILIPLSRNPIWWIHDYPKDIQDVYFETHDRIPYDCFFLDWVVFANWRRIRLPGTEHMDDAYHQKTYHAVRAGIGMILGLLPCLLCGLIVMVIG